jgi:hypothetical protein
MNVPPYNPVYSTYGVRSTGSTCRATPTTYLSSPVMSGYSGKPQLILNPYVDQTKYKGLGE